MHLEYILNAGLMKDYGCFVRFIVLIYLKILQNFNFIKLLDLSLNYSLSFYEQIFVVWQQEKLLMKIDRNKSFLKVANIMIIFE
jgi:hypothetical protein